MPETRRSVLHVKRKLTCWAYFFAAFIMLTGFLALLGWQFDITLLKRPIPGLVAMNPVTALSFVITGISFLFLSSKKKSKQRLDTGYILAGFVILVSILKIAGALIPSIPQVDQIIFSKEIRADASGNLSSRMAINTAFGFIFSGIALVLLNYQTSKKRKPSHLIALVVFMFGFFSVLGYLYQVPEFYDLLYSLPMAVHTAICFIFFSLSIFFIHPYEGVTKEFTSPLAGGIAGRLLIPAAFIIPLALGILRIYFNRTIFFSFELGTTFLVLSIVIIYCSLICYSVVLLNRKDSLRIQAEEKFRESEKKFSTLVTSVRDYAIFMLDVNGNVVTWNKGAEAIKGYKEEEIRGKNISVFYTKEDVEKGLPEYILRMAKENGRSENEGWRLRKDGSKLWADAVVTALYGNEGKLTGFAKVTRDITERKKTRDMLTKFNEELNKQVKEKTEKLEETTAQLRRLSAYLQIAREEERRSIAREMHDELGQMLTGLKMDIVWLRKNISSADEIVSRDLAEHWNC